MLNNTTYNHLKYCKVNISDNIMIYEYQNKTFNILSHKILFQYFIYLRYLVDHRNNAKHVTNYYQFIYTSYQILIPSVRYQLGLVQLFFVFTQTMDLTKMKTNYVTSEKMPCTKQINIQHFCSFINKSTLFPRNVYKMCLVKVQR